MIPSFPFITIQRSAQQLLSGEADNTFSIVTFMWFTMLYKDGYSLAKDLCPSQMPSQNLGPI
jgi:hypothetical protein